MRFQVSFVLISVVLIIYVTAGPIETKYVVYVYCFSQFIFSNSIPFLL